MIPTWDDSPEAWTRRAARIARRERERTCQHVAGFRHGLPIYCPARGIPALDEQGEVFAYLCDRHHPDRAPRATREE